jgi:AraC-like DNA-binding protein
MNVTDIAFSSGFNSLEYFISAFRMKYKFSPTKYRLEFLEGNRGISKLPAKNKFPSFL